MEIRKMQPRDVAPIAELEKICFNDPWSENSIASELDNRLSYWLVAIQDDQLIGYVGSQSVLDGADMMNIAVSPHCRRMGVAEALVNALVEALKARGVRFLMLEVRVSNAPAIALYEKLGFKQAGCRRNYYRNPKEDALILRKEWDV